MQELSFNTSPQREDIAKLQLKYLRIVSEKKEELEAKNKEIQNNRGILNFDLKPGKEITLALRENSSEIIKELQKFSEISIPLKQINELYNVINTHRFFIANDIDHERARVEFDSRKMELVKKYEDMYSLEWPKYSSNIYCNNEIFAQEGKNVSRHHAFPVRVLIIENGSPLEAAIENGEIDLKKGLNLEHYKVNEHWNLIPMKDPKGHIDGIHGDTTTYSKVFGKIIQDYHYKQIDPMDDTRFESIIKDKEKVIKLPEFSSNLDFYLSKMEVKLAMPINSLQREHIYNYIGRYVKYYPENNFLKKASYEQILDNLSCFHRNKELQKQLKSEWEYFTKNTWPPESKIEFLIPPYYNINNYQWWMIHPKKESIEHYIENKNKRKRTFINDFEKGVELHSEDKIVKRHKKGA
jgi:hypothetical protein